MIIVNLIGGLGNQMFQYAFGYALSQTRDDDLRFDKSAYESYFRSYELDIIGLNSETISEKDIIKITHTSEKTFEVQFRENESIEVAQSGIYNSYEEPHFNYDENAFKTIGNTYFRGYWQTERYFKIYRSNLLELFRPKIDHPLSTQYKKEIVQSKSVSLHIRRGDYVKNHDIYKKHGICSIEYYTNAVSYINKKDQDCHFFIFSDDINWSKQNMDFIQHKTFIELSKDVPDYEEMYLMSLCQHNIIANSSFSWWGAWLNDNPDKIVIAPEHWFKNKSMNSSDIIPKEWIQIFSAEKQNRSTPTLAFTNLSYSFNSSISAADDQKK